MGAILKQCTSENVVPHPCFRPRHRRRSVRTHSTTWARNRVSTYNSTQSQRADRETYPAHQLYSGPRHATREGNWSTRVHCHEHDQVVALRPSPSQRYRAPPKWVSHLGVHHIGGQLAFTTIKKMAQLIASNLVHVLGLFWRRSNPLRVGGSGRATDERRGCKHENRSAWRNCWSLRGCAACLPRIV